MATYHCCVKKAKKGKALRHADYILREGVYEASPKKEELLHKAHGNLPEWAATPQDFWREADQRERANGNVYYEFEIALPNELSLDEQKKIVERMIETHVGAKAYTYAIHQNYAALSESEILQPHVHLMFCERVPDGISRGPEQYFKRANPRFSERGGTPKDDRFTKDFSAGSEAVLKIRKDCEKFINEAYKANGFDITVSADSLVAQKERAARENDFKKAALLDRVPENHLGPKLAQQSVRLAAEAGKNLTEESCIEAFASERARKAFIARALRETKTEMQKLDAEIAVLRKREAIRESSLRTIEQVVAMPTADDRNRILAQIAETQKTLRHTAAQISRLQRTMLSDAQMLRIAQSVYTRGQSKRLMLQYNALEQERRAIDALRRIRAVVPHRGTWIEMQKRETAFRREEAVLSRKISLLKEKLALPVAQQRVAKLMMALRQKDAGRKQRLVQLQAAADEMQLQLKRLEAARDAIDKARLASEMADEFDAFVADVDDLRRRDRRRDEVLETARGLDSAAVILHGHEIQQVIDYHIRQMYEDLNESKRAARRIERTLLSDDKQLLVAQSVFSRGKSKKLTKEFNVLRQERQDYERAYEAYKKAPLQARTIEAKKQLELRRAALEAKEAKNQREIAALRGVMERPAAQEKIKAILTALQGKGAVRKQRLEVYQKNIAQINGQLEQLRAIRREISHEWREHAFQLQNPISRASGAEVVVQECKSVVQQMRAAVAQATLARSTKGMKAKLTGKERIEDEFERS